MSTKNELSLTLKRVRRGLRTEVNTGATPIAVNSASPAPPVSAACVTVYGCNSNPCQTVVTKGGSIGGFKIYKGSGG